MKTRFWFQYKTMSPAVSSPKWLSNCARVLYSIICFVVFLIFDLLDAVFCVIYRYLDERIEGEASPCCCSNSKRQNKKKIYVTNDEDDGLSDSLYERKSIFRELGFLLLGRKRENSNRKCSKGFGRSVNRWSDCGCESCLSWVNDGDYKLHFVMRERLIGRNCRGYPSENVIFLHGFLCSSSFWSQTVFPHFSEKVNHNYRLIALDLLGFGKSPKPRDCLYTLKDHVEMIEKSVIQPLQLSNFHLVAHSMGCIIALALAAKYPKSVKSITLVAPPYTSSEGNNACLNALAMLAGKKLWPALSFGSSFMSWYEHLGRTVCFVFCRNHRIWERILKLITRKRDLHFLTIDLTRHTHQSAWSSMHNVICGGAKFMDSYLIILTKGGVRINVTQGDKDQVVPMECCSNFKLKAPNAEINIIPNADHSTVIFGREKEFAHSLEHTWTSCC
ncbi:probable lysophospholipase BODYGUARD 4 isoform X2 [Gastrolobium bilobum]|uniref:probable lysophospholipase BODYGUARD 4 isoform X2 n=1 Tax=Gastrolobium bilobum TaxID=150636 RepID=UPI002AB06BB0|nr:probable lysophospholipase BODYGUARD 4 isoform X2 [Gastrolobium bilobum]